MCVFDPSGMFFVTVLILIWFRYVILATCFPRAFKRKFFFVKSKINILWGSSVVQRHFGLWLWACLGLSPSAPTFWWEAWSKVVGGIVLEKKSHINFIFNKLLCILIYVKCICMYLSFLAFFVLHALCMS